MSTDTKESSNDILQGNPTTANDLAEMLNGNYRTIRKILIRMHDNGEIKQTTVKRANRDTIAYYLNNTTIKNIQKELREIRKGKKSIVGGEDAKLLTNVYNRYKDKNLQVLKEISPNDTNDNANVKIYYETIQKNYELENELRDLKVIYEKEHEKAITLEADLKIANGNLKLIEYKQSTFESENSKLNQELTKLNQEKLETSFRHSKELKTRNIIIGLLSAILLVIVAVGLTIYMLRAV